MKKFYISTCLIFCSVITCSQDYFNERIEFGQSGIWDGVTTTFLLPDGYILGGTTGTPENFLWHRLGFYKLDFYGNKIFSKLYWDTISEYFIGNPGSIIRFNDSLIIVAGSKNTYTPNWVHQEGLLYFLNNDFDTLMTKSFGEKDLPIDTSYLLFQLKKTNLNEIITVGNKKPYGLAEKIILIKTDNIGKNIWEKSYGYGYYYQGHSVVSTSDGGFAIGGFTYYPTSPPNTTGDPVLIKTDSTGNQQWMLILGGFWRDSPAMVCNSSDGNIIVGTSYCDSMDSDDVYRRINIVKVDNNKNILWNKKYGNSAYGLTLTNIRENSDGSLIATGIMPQFFPTNYKYVGWLLKTDSDGDSIWYRQYVVCEGEGSWNWLYDVIQTPDNGYLACGTVFPEVPDTGSQDGWVLKVDSLGCEAPVECWVGMQKEIDIPSNDFVSFYPNPAEQETAIKLRITDYELRIRIRLFDLFGREVRNITLSPLQTEYQLDVSDLPAGLYLSIVESGDVIIGREKLVVR